MMPPLVRYEYCSLVRVPPPPPLRQVLYCTYHGAVPVQGMLLRVTDSDYITATRGNARIGDAQKSIPIQATILRTEATDCGFDLTHHSLIRAKDDLGMVRVWVPITAFMSFGFRLQ